jgi:NAD(P)-dependent dehydrogenase (short-subunit alcohol dehydrogenase family)
VWEHSELAGRGAIVTGGIGDIGRAVAAELLRRGASVTLADRRPASDADGVLAPLAALGAVAYRRVDVRDRDAVEHALDDIDPLDIAIGNAGIVEAAPFLELTEEQWCHHLDVNLTGCFHLGQAAARRMVDRRHPGRIVFTGSWVQDVPWPEIAPYSVSKAGLRMLARSMARELARHGILVNVVAPGIVDAGLAGRQLRTDPAYAARASRVVPLARFQTPADVAQAVAFTCSAAADYMTGSVLLVDGGCSLFQFDVG